MTISDRFFLGIADLINQMMRGPKQRYLTIIVCAILLLQLSTYAAFCNLNSCESTFPISDDTLRKLQILSAGQDDTNVTVLLQENFENYTSGSFPQPPWEWWFDGAGLCFNNVSDTFSRSGNKSLCMKGLAGWGSVTARQIQQIIETLDSGDTIGYNVSVMVHDYGTPGQIGAWVGFNLLQGAGWGGWTEVAFTCDGQIISRAATLQNYSLDAWYNIYVEFHVSERQYSVWINNILRAENLTEANSADPKTDLRYFGLASDHGEQQCFFDDIAVFRVTQSPPIPASFAIKLDTPRYWMRPNESARLPISIAPDEGFSNSVILNANVSSAYVSVKINPKVIGPNETSVLTLVVSSEADSGICVVEISGTAGDIKKYYYLQLDIVKWFALECDPINEPLYPGDINSTRVILVLLYPNPERVQVRLDYSQPPNGVELSLSNKTFEISQTSSSVLSSTLTISVSSDARPWSGNITLTAWVDSSYNLISSNSTLNFAIEERPVNATLWTRFEFWIPFGLLVLSSLLAYRFYRKWRIGRLPPDGKYAIDAKELAKLYERRSRNEIGESEFRKLEAKMRAWLLNGRQSLEEETED
jgi:hypothetical protein